MMLTNNLRMAGEMYIRRIYFSTNGQVQLGPQQAKRIEASCLIYGPNWTTTTGVAALSDALLLASQ